MRWQRCSDRAGEFQKAFVTGLALECPMHQAPGASNVAPCVGELRLKERELGTAQGRVLAQPVEAVLSAIVLQLCEEQTMPLAQRLGPAVTDPIRTRPALLPPGRVVPPRHV